MVKASKTYYYNGVDCDGKTLLLALIVSLETIETVHVLQRVEVGFQCAAKCNSCFYSSVLNGKRIFRECKS